MSCPDCQGVTFRVDNKDTCVECNGQFISEHIASLTRERDEAVSRQQQQERITLSYIRRLHTAQNNAVEASKERDKWHTLVAEYCRKTKGPCICGCHISEVMEGTQ